MIDSEERVILVDENDEEIGTAEKLAAHRSGDLHRAFSVFLYNEDGLVLLQRRAGTKYHSPGLWSNTCCGHPRPGEDTLAAASRRLTEELGISGELQHASTFRYQATLRDGLVEHEIDHVFTGLASGDPNPDPAEVSEWQWMTIEDVSAWLAREPGAFTAWFAGVFDRATR